jgi:hypothetical protein
LECLRLLISFVTPLGITTPFALNLNVHIKLVLPLGRPIIRASEMQKNINMKFELDIMYGILLAMLIVLYTINARDTNKLQTEIDELRLIVNNKFVSSMILDKEKLMPR